MSPSLVDAALRRREIGRRRLLLGTLGLLLVLSTIPVLGHHVVAAVDWLPATLEHVGPFCMVALHLLLAPVHWMFHGLLLVGVLFASVERVRALGRLRSELARIDLEPLQGGKLQGGKLQGGNRLLDALHLAGVSPAHVRVGSTLTVPAFTAGLFRPRIYISGKLVRTLRTEELAAILMHEEAHRVRRDPLRLTVLRFFSSLLFWMPAFRRLADDLSDEAEIDADTVAAECFPSDLASAMVVLARNGGEQRQLASLVPFHRADLLERRLERLAGIEPQVSSRVSRRAILLATGALLVAWSSGVMVLHPLPVGNIAHVGEPHCLHHTGGPLTHLFCRGSHWTLRESECPHRV